MIIDAFLCRSSISGEMTFFRGFLAATVYRLGPANDSSACLRAYSLHAPLLFHCRSQALYQVTELVGGTTGEAMQEKGAQLSTPAARCWERLRSATPPC